MITVEPTPELIDSGLRKIKWAAAHMHVLQRIANVFQEDRPLEGLVISMSIHLEAKTANLARLLQAGGAEVHVTGSNVLSTQDDVAVALATFGIDVNAIHGVDSNTYTSHLVSTLECHPHIVIDDGGDLIDLLAGNCKCYADRLIGGCEETTTGILRLKARDKDGTLPCPMFAVNDAKCKHYYDNKYGTGQSVITAIMNTTNLVLAGKTVVVAGYGWCGKGVAERARGMGANVIVTEIDPFKALDATMNGFRVMKMEEAAPIGDVFVTVTGCKDVITIDHMRKMKNKVVLCNAGHFDCEVSVKDLKLHTVVPVLHCRNNIDRYVIRNELGTDAIDIYLLAEGRLVNLASGDGHPVEIMDMSFAVQALTINEIATKHRNKDLTNHLYRVPDDIDDTIGMIKLRTQGIHIDTLTKEQESYLNSYKI